MRKVRAAEMYVFGVVVSANNDTPVGRASAALRVQLPALFPEHSIEFIDPKEIQALGPEKPDEMLFLVFGAAVRMDVIGVRIGRRRTPEITHLQGVG